VSVATISTNASRSPSLPAHIENQGTLQSTASRTSGQEKKRRRSSKSSEGSYMSVADDSREREFDMARNRSTRRKYSEVSPATRGRRRSRSFSSDHESKLLRARSQNRSPLRRGRRISASNSNRKDFDMEDGSASPPGRSTRNQPPSPNIEDTRSKRRSRDRSLSSDSLGRRRYSDVDERYGTTSRNSERFSRPSKQVNHSLRRAPPRERSLSPFSKRLALTQSINHGR
jgi:hypothetical protein